MMIGLSLKKMYGDRPLAGGGALDLIGDRYYRDAFYNRISKESYRQVLRIMATDPERIRQLSLEEAGAAAEPAEAKEVTSS